MRAADWPHCGYVVFPWDARTYGWSQAARRVGREIVSDPAMRAQWLTCDGTWFVGVDALPNDPDGAISGRSLAGPAIDWVGSRQDLHRAQVSVTYPGYPRPRDGESDAAFRFRQTRDAAHMDGILADGTPKRRYYRERHIWILGLPLTETSPGASPLVVWSGSQSIMQDALCTALSGVPDAQWGDIDITDVYIAARKTVFATCRRVPLFARPGQAILLHPYLIHGVAPWQVGASAPKEGRMVAYFRPESRDSVSKQARQK